jgi:FkbM family methyltransferase
MSLLKNLFYVCDNSFDVLKVYLFGGTTQASLHDSNGGNLLLEVSKENVKKVISLSNFLAKFQELCKVHNNRIDFEPWSDVRKSFSPSLTSEDLHELHEFEILTNRHISSCERFDHDKYLVTDLEGLRWILREGSLARDADFGLLLADSTEPKEHKWFLEALRESGVFVDVGANVGGYSVRAAKMGIEVIAVEPDPDNFCALNLNLKLNNLSNVHLLRVAAGNKEEIRQLYYGSDRGPHTYRLEQDEDTLEAKCDVEVKSLDLAIPPFLGDNWINMLKIDTEGFEVKVLEGASNLLKRTRYIIVEVSPATESKLNNVLSLLGTMGFELIDKECTFPGEYNLFLRKSKRAVDSYQFCLAPHLAEGIHNQCYTVHNGT